MPPDGVQPGPWPEQLYAGVGRSAGIEVLLDDRATRPGVKFNGCRSDRHRPARVVGRGAARQAWWKWWNAPVALSHELAPTPCAFWLGARKCDGLGAEGVLPTKEPFLSDSALHPGEPLSQSLGL